MKKRIAAIVLCVFCLLAIAGCSQSKPDAAAHCGAGDRRLSDDHQRDL